MATPRCARVAKKPVPSLALWLVFAGTLIVAAVLVSSGGAASGAGAGVLLALAAAMMGLLLYAYLRNRKGPPRAGP
jgi:hypothetical protein